MFFAHAEASVQPSAPDNRSLFFTAPETGTGDPCRSFDRPCHMMTAGPSPLEGEGHTAMRAIALFSRIILV
ncbi:hypothetical protein FF80_03105 [Devosia sp. LC5]|mgnify:CR=1 FL=1|nr:hypothetical protein FF80_03105 [Devosia sp. LC5]